MSKLLLLLTFLINFQMLITGEMIKITSDLFVGKDTIRLGSNELKIDHDKLGSYRNYHDIRSDKFVDEVFEHDKTAITIFELAQEIQQKTVSGVKCEKLKNRLAQLVTPDFVYREQDRQHLADIVHQAEIQEGDFGGSFGVGFIVGGFLMFCRAMDHVTGYPR